MVVDADGAVPAIDVFSRRVYMAPASTQGNTTGNRIHQNSTLGLGPAEQTALFPAANRKRTTF